MGNYAWELQVSAMLDPFFTELFLDLCSREEILNVEMELGVVQFINLGNSTMKISSKNMTNQDLCQWPTQDQTPTEPNFSSLWKKLLGLMENMLFLEKLETQNPSKSPKI